MNFKKIKNLFFILTVKTPITIILIITLTFTSLITLAYKNYTDVYIKLQGTVEQNNLQETNYIKVNIDDKYTTAINKNSKVVWYLSSNGKRYEGNISELDSKDKTNNSYTAIVAASSKDLKNEFKDTDLIQDKQVTVEICLKKVRILDKILKLNSEAKQKTIKFC